MARLKDLAYLQVIALIIALFFSLINRWYFFPAFIFSLFMSNAIGILIESMRALTWKRMHISQKGRISQALYWTSLIVLCVCVGSIGGAELYRRIIHDRYITIPRDFYPWLLLFNGLIAVIATSVQVVYSNLKTSIEHKARENQELQLRQIQTQLTVLQAKINPHVLFNTLNTMLSLLKKSPDKVEKMILNLSDIYHRILRLPETGKVSLDDEVTLLREYLEIEKIRLGDRLSYALEIEPALTHANILPLLLEPIVENAVIHGIGPKPQGGHIIVSASRRDGMMSITITDNGAGLDPAAANGGFGLRSVRERLQLAYEGRAQLCIQPLSGGGTSVSLEIPLED
jgi:sensor histidine kinase YesM